jgi:putative membrane protein
MPLIARIFGALAGVSLAGVSSGSTQEIGGATARFAELPWNWEPWILICLGLALFGYARGLCRLDPEVRARVFGVWRGASFAAGIGTLFVALISPFDALDDELFSAHMVQHLLLMMVAAPLLVWGRPAMAFLWAFPQPARRALGRFWNGSGLHRGVHTLMSPLLVWVLCGAVLWFWHIPAPYGWALENEGVHTLEHFCFLLTALMFWTLVLEPFGRRRLSYGQTILFVATLGVQNGLLGALLTFAGHPFYRAHFTTTAAWGLTPLEDQQLAGLIMWMPASLIHLGALVVLFIAWMNDAESEAKRATSSLNTAKLSSAALRYGTLVSIVLTLSLSACGRDDAQSLWAMPGATPARAPSLMRAYGCPACHAIPGVVDARGLAGPSLARFAQRTYIAGVLSNRPENLVKWVRAPQTVIPGNAMPNAGVTEEDARDIAAYLYTLQ